MMTKMPPRIAKLDRDARGYPIPWNVLRNEAGEPFFTINDNTRYIEALQFKLCPICGEGLDETYWFVGGPLSAFHRDGWYHDLPTHEECAEYSLATCPYLAAPRYVRRIDVPLHKLDQLPNNMILLDPTMIPERPEIFVMTTGRGMNCHIRHIRGTTVEQILVRPKRPLVEWRFWRVCPASSSGDALSALKTEH